MEVGRWAATEDEREGVLWDGAMWEEEGEVEEEEGEGGTWEDGEVGEGVERGGGEGRGEAEERAE